MRTRRGVRCQNCGFTVNTLYGVELKYHQPVIGPQGLPPIIANAMWCRRCMTKNGLFEREKKGYEDKSRLFVRFRTR